ncbi:MAG: 23S rRNA (pseudouridine(1915)-N(3))-methyltransferase RlmH, partial [Pseudomonadota bacterium]
SRLGPAAIFMIGGADGLQADVRDQSDLVLAFGRITLPHQIARAVLMEQIYRAMTILAGHPYHRD